MVATSLFVFTLLSLTSLSNARRVGGSSGGGSDGDDESGSGGDTSGSGSSSSGSNTCYDSRANQDAEIYMGPTYSSYYNGQLTFKYRLSRSSTGGPSDSEPFSPGSCVYADGLDHTFTYDAVMNIGATTTQGDGQSILDFLLWEIRAFIKWEPGYLGDNAPRREVLRLSSLGYPDLMVTYPNGTREDHVYTRETSWSVDITPERNSTGNIISVNVDTISFIPRRATMVHQQLTTGFHWRTFALLGMNLAPRNMLLPYIPQKGGTLLAVEFC
ncbi:hypothetical protein ABW19_dt0209491 [Dactylella cylindrospora]|nr:hypothetical protein ABW19_dt0209491 [Dactylella cylindrospora]